MTGKKVGAPIPRTGNGAGVIRWSVDEGIGRIVLDDPPANGMSLRLFEELQHIIAAVPDSGARALVIHGMGRHFSHGADLDELIASIASDSSRDADGRIASVPDFIKRNTAAFLSLRKMRIPVIAAIRGVCLGSAFELALSCNFRICGKGAVFALPESTYSLIPGCGGIGALMRVAGKSGAMDLLLSGRQFSSETALELGIADLLVNKKSVVDEAVGLARRLIMNEKGVA